MREEILTKITAMPKSETAQCRLKGEPDERYNYITQT